MLCLFFHAGCNVPNTLSEVCTSRMALRIWICSPIARAAASSSARPQREYVANSGRPAWRSVQASACPRSNPVAAPPIQAAKSRPDRKTVGSATVAAIALAPMTPMPGMVSSRLLASFERSQRERVLRSGGRIYEHGHTRRSGHQLMSTSREIDFSHRSLRSCSWRLAPARSGWRGSFRPVPRCGGSL
jgi:hypothetical protein